MTKLIIALDTKDLTEVEHLLKESKGLPVLFKVGMELFYAHHKKPIKLIAKYGKRIFLDLKLHDIPTTVEKSILNFKDDPIELINIHCLGGSEMMRRAILAINSFKDKTYLIGVTHLTSMNEQNIQSELGIPRSLDQSTNQLAKLAFKNKLHGVVCSGHEVSSIKTHTHQNFLCITPGIRPYKLDCQDQKRVMTPVEAFDAGSDYIVVGRPITKASNPRNEMIKILKEIHEY